MKLLLAKLTEMNEIWGKCPNLQERVEKALKIFSHDELQLWYGMILAQSGLGVEGYTILKDLYKRRQPPYATLLRNIAAAYFHRGLYTYSYRCYMKAASEERRCSLDMNARVISYWLDAAEALRQQRKFLKEFWLLVRCWRHLRDLSIRKGQKNSQEWAGLYDRLAKNPFVFLMQWKNALWTKAEEIRWKEPIERVAVERTRLRLGITAPHHYETEDSLAPRTFEDISIHYRRLAQALGEVNSYRDEARELLGRYRVTGKDTYLKCAKNRILESLELAEQYLDHPGCAKGIWLLAEIEYLSKNYTMAAKHYQRAWEIFKGLQLGWKLRLVRWLQTYFKGLCIRFVLFISAKAGSSQ
jgi:tetratricopeptide (TPR) repeat protein